MTQVSTKADPAGARWRITGPIVRFRVFGTDDTYPLAPGAESIVGTADACEIRLHDPSGLISRRHAAISEVAGDQVITDLGSTNGISIDGKAGKSFSLSPLDTLQVGGLTLLAESASSLALRELVQRFVGWSVQAQPDVDRTLRALRDASHFRTSLIIFAHGSALGVAQRLHDEVVGSHRPFVTRLPDESGVDAQRRAFDGTLYLDGEKLPRDIQGVLMTLRVPSTRTRLVIGTATVEAAAEVATRIPVVTRISIPSLEGRGDEVARVLEAYASDAATKLDAASPNLRADDVSRVRQAGVASHVEAAEVMYRLVAVRNWGVVVGAERVGISHGAMSRYWGRRRIGT